MGSRTSASPYRFLLIFAAGMTLFLGVVIYLALRLAPPAAKDPQRTAFWLAEPQPATGPGRDMIVLLEEPAPDESGGLTVLVLPAQLTAGRQEQNLAAEPGRGEAAAGALMSLLGRRVHQYAVVPAATLAQLVNLTGGVNPDGRPLDGAAAVEYLFGADSAAERMERAPRLLLGLLQNAAAGRIQASLQEGLAVVRGMETNIPVLTFPDLLGRWVSLTPVLHKLPGRPGPDGRWEVDAPALDRILRPDPAPRR